MAVVDHPGPIRRRDHREFRAARPCGGSGTFRSIFSGFIMPVAASERNEPAVGNRTQLLKMSIEP